MNLAEKKEFVNKLYTGFTLLECLALNPTREELAALKGYTLKEPEEGKEALKEIEYEGKDASGDEYVEIVAYMRSLIHPDKPIMQHRFRFVDKDVVSEKEENGVKTSKFQYVNQQGWNVWCDDEKNLLDKFTKVQKKTYQDKVLISTENIGDSAYRKAIQGEAGFYNFFQAWMDGVAYTGEACIPTDIFIDKKKMFRNINKYVESELRPLIKDARARKFNGLATVGIQEKEGKVNHFQNLYSEFWPDGKNSGWKFKTMLTSITSGDWTINEGIIKTHTYLVDRLKKSAFTLGWIKEFSERDHIQATSETFREAADDSTSEATDTVY